MVESLNSRREKKKLRRRPKLPKRLRIPRLNEERQVQKKGFKSIVGLDEVGRGALAGPVVACAFLLNNKRIYKVRDSKLLSSRAREKLAERIKKEAKAWAIGCVDNHQIEKLGIHKATLLAFQLALGQLNRKIDFILVDAYRLPGCKIPYKNIKKGDMVCYSIACASILAKVYRDKLMRDLAKKYPGYFFEDNKGYGTRKHLEALERLGACPIHRKSFRPVKEVKEVEHL